MKIKVNGEVRKVAEGSAVADILADAALGGTATALNGRFVPKDARAQALLREGDEVTIISAAYGG